MVEQLCRPLFYSHFLWFPLTTWGQELSPFRVTINGRATFSWASVFLLKRSVLLLGSQVHRSKSSTVAPGSQLRGQTPSDLQEYIKTGGVLSAVLDTGWHGAKSASQSFYEHGAEYVQGSHLINATNHRLLSNTGGNNCPCCFFFSWLLFCNSPEQGWCACWAELQSYITVFVLSEPKGWGCRLIVVLNLIEQHILFWSKVASSFWTQWRVT